MLVKKPIHWPSGEKNGMRRAFGAGEQDGIDVGQVAKKQVAAAVAQADIHDAASVRRNRQRQVLRVGDFVAGWQRDGQADR